jgi:hypothetical protein
MAENENYKGRTLGDFTPSPVTRGRITNRRTGYTIYFGLNPNRIQNKKGISLSEDMIPLSSHPLIRYAGGKARTITFSLELNGELISRRRQQVRNGLYEESSNPFSVAGEIQHYRSLIYPVSKEEGGSGDVDRLVLNYGTLFRQVVCFVTDVEDDTTQWSPELEPVISTVRLSLTVDEGPKTIFSNEIWTRG